jgi:hypothetical protein
VQAARFDTVGYSASLETGGPELLEMNMAVLQLRQARQFGVAGPANLLKPNNRPSQSRFS